MNMAIGQETMSSKPFSVNTMSGVESAPTSSYADFVSFG